MNFFEKRRKELGLSLMDVARAVGCWPQSVSQWESGVCLPGLDKADALAAVLKVNVDRVLAEMKDLAVAKAG
jgi:transcriptional regulator with XRE-family HTH domain